MIERIKLFLMLTILIVLTFYILKYLEKEYFQNEYFKNEPINIITSITEQNLLPSPTTIPLDRTLLYGSLFLDNLDEIKKNMTDPDIKYDKKRLELFKYYDVLY